MNRVQFSFPSRGLNITKVLQAPKNRTLTSLWLRQARKSIPEIPNLDQHPDWYIYREVISDDTILLELHDSAGQKCAVIIERKDYFSPR